MSEEGKQLGHTIIPATRRMNGTWRKAIKVKEGYVPPDEQPKYKINKVYTSEKSEFPVGLAPEDIEKAKQMRIIREAKEHGLELSFTMMSKSAKKKAKKKLAKQEAEQKLLAEMNNLQIKKSQAHEEEVEAKKSEISKKLKNLRKKLNDTESLEIRVESNEVQPDKDQIEKLRRKPEVLQEIKDLEVLLKQLNEK